MDLTSHFITANDVVDRPQGGKIRKEDFRLTRFAAYLVAMNGAVLFLCLTINGI